MLFGPSTIHYSPFVSFPVVKSRQITVFLMIFNGYRPFLISVNCCSLVINAFIFPMVPKNCQLFQKNDKNRETRGYFVLQFENIYSEVAPILNPTDSVPPPSVHLRPISPAPRLRNLFITADVSQREPPPPCSPTVTRLAARRRRWCRVKCSLIGRRSGQAK